MRAFPQPRTFPAVVTLVAAVVVLCLAAQDLWGYHRAVTQRWTAWAISEQSLLQLAGGIGKLLATVSLLVMSDRLLGRKFSRSIQGRVSDTEAS
jgi:hypothetical protein